MAYLGETELLTKNGIKSVYSILRENEIVYTGIEDLNKLESFYLKNFALETSISFKDIYKVNYIGRKMVHTVTFMDDTSNVFTFDQKLLLILSDRMIWRQLEQLKFKDVVMSLNKVDGKILVNPKQIKQVTNLFVKPVWVFVDENYSISSNGIVSRC